MKTDEWVVAQESAERGVNVTLGREPNPKVFKSFTLGMIKSHAVVDKQVGSIISMIEKSDLYLLEARLRQLSPPGGAAFYAEHEGRPYFEGLIKSVTSGPVFALLLGSEDVHAVTKWRGLMGATDPTQAESWTLRAIFGTVMPFNAVHGSDSRESFEEEAEFFFGVLPGITRSM